MTQTHELKVGDYVILRGQRKGRYHLEGGVIVSIRVPNAAVLCDNVTLSIPLYRLELLTDDYVTPRGNEVVPFEMGEQS